MMQKPIQKPAFNIVTYLDMRVNRSSSSAGVTGIIDYWSLVHNITCSIVYISCHALSLCSELCVSYMVLVRYSRPQSLIISLNMRVLLFLCRCHRWYWLLIWFLWNLYLYLYLFIFVYICICVCICISEAAQVVGRYYRPQVGWPPV